MGKSQRYQAAVDGHEAAEPVIGCKPEKTLHKASGVGIQRLTHIRRLLGTAGELLCCLCNVSEYSEAIFLWKYGVFP